MEFNSKGNRRVFLFGLYKTTFSGHFFLKKILLTGNIKKGRLKAPRAIHGADVTSNERGSILSPPPPPPSQDGIFKGGEGGWLGRRAASLFNATTPRPYWARNHLLEGSKPSLLSFLRRWQRFLPGKAGKQTAEIRPGTGSPAAFSTQW